MAFSVNSKKVEETFRKQLEERKARKSRAESLSVTSDEGSKKKRSGLLFGKHHKKDAPVPAQVTTTVDPSISSFASVTSSVPSTTTTQRLSKLDKKKQAAQEAFLNIQQTIQLQETREDDLSRQISQAIAQAKAQLTAGKRPAAACARSSAFRPNRPRSAPPLRTSRLSRSRLTVH